MIGAVWQRITGFFGSVEHETATTLADVENSLADAAGARQHYLHTLDSAQATAEAHNAAAQDNISALSAVIAQHQQNISLASAHTAVVKAERERLMTAPTATPLAPSLGDESQQAA